MQLDTEELTSDALHSSRRKKAPPNARPPELVAVQLDTKELTRDALHDLWR